MIRLLQNAVATLVDLLPRRQTPEQRRLGQRLASDLQAIVASPLAGARSEFWRETCLELCACAEDGDADYFMRWPPIARTMVHGTTPHALAAYRLLRRSPGWRGHWSAALHYAEFGHPPPFLRDLRTNAVAIQHASHLLLFAEATGRSFLDADCIVELGGGYGSMCGLAHRLGYRGCYVIFDQPPVLALQRYYLGLHGLEAAYASDEPAARIALCRSLGEVVSIVAAGGFKQISLISTWALSEMPLGLRQELEALIELEALAQVLLSYQTEFTGIDNRRYFTDLLERTNRRFAWRHFEIEFLVDNYYAFGLAKAPRAQ